MSSFKSLVTLVILATIGGYLYLKITETEPIVPPEAAELSFDVPQIELGDDSFSETAGGETAAPPFNPSSDSTEAPAWSPPPVVAQSPAQTTNAIHSGTAHANTPPPSIELPPASPADESNTQRPSNPFSGLEDTVSEETVAPPAAAAHPQLDASPPVAASPPPGAVARPHDAVMEGRVYDEPPIGTAAPPVTSTTTIAQDTVPPAHAEIAPIGSPESGQETSISATLQAIEVSLDKGELAQALRLLSDYVQDPSLAPHEQEEIDELLSQLAGTVIYSTEHRLEPAYRVLPGDTLDSIADKYQVSPQLLAKINGVANPSQLTPGTELKVLRGPFTAVVDLTRGELVVMLDGRYAGRFPIHVGADQAPIEGGWIVSEKERNPQYIGTTESVPGGDPTNPLGDRMLTLSSPTGASGGFGIHGSPPGTTADPRGSIRLSASDASDVYDILTVGSRVVVRR